NTLDNFDIISRGVFRRQKAEHRAGGASDGIDVAGKGFAVGVGLDVSLLSGLHVAQRGLFEIGSDPNALERHDDEKALACLNNLAVFDGLVRGHAVDRSNYIAVTEIELGGIELCAGAIDAGELRLGVGRAHGYALLVGVRGSDASLSLSDAS